MSHFMHAPMIMQFAVISYILVEHGRYQRNGGHALCKGHVDSGWVHGMEHHGSLLVPHQGMSQHKRDVTHVP